MKKKLALLFAFAVSFIFTSLIIMSDPDIDGIEGLASFNSIAGVVLLSFFPFAVMCTILFISSEFGTKEGLIVLFLFSIITMFILMMISQPHLSFSQKLDTMARSTTFMIFIIVFGVFPYLYVCHKAGKKKGLISIVLFSITLIYIIIRMNQPDFSFPPKMDTVLSTFILLLGAFPYWLSFINKETLKFSSETLNE